MNLLRTFFAVSFGWTAAQPFTASAARAEPAVSASQVVERMIEMDAARRAALTRYTAVRLYVAANKRFNKRAEVTVSETYALPGTKTFEVLSAKGSSFIRKRAIDKLIDAESDSAHQDNRDQTRIGPEHYTFRLIGSEILDGRPAFIIEVNPRKELKYLMRGRIWIDEADFAITRLEASPARNPSFWTRNVRIVRTYRKFGQFWLPVLTESESDIRIAGKSTLRIEYNGYQIAADPRQAANPGREGER